MKSLVIIFILALNCFSNVNANNAGSDIRNKLCQSSSKSLKQMIIVYTDRCNERNSTNDLNLDKVYLPLDFFTFEHSEYLLLYYNEENT